MSVFTYSDPITETSGGGGPKSGEYKMVVTTVEEKTSQAGNKYLNIVLTDEEDRAIYYNLFPQSTADYPKQQVANFCTVCGFLKEGKIDLASWSDLEGKELIVLARIDTYTNRNGDTKEKRVVHGVYTTKCWSAKEVADGKKGDSFEKNLKFCIENPSVKKKSDAPQAAATAATEEDLPF